MNLLRQTIRNSDPKLVVTNLRTMDSQLNERLTARTGDRDARVQLRSHRDSARRHRPVRSARLRHRATYAGYRYPHGTEIKPHTHHTAIVDGGSHDLADRRSGWPGRKLGATALGQRVATLYQMFRSTCRSIPMRPFYGIALLLALASGLLFGMVANRCAPTAQTQGNFLGAVDDQGCKQAAQVGAGGQENQSRGSLRISSVSTIQRPRSLIQPTVALDLRLIDQRHPEIRSKEQRCSSKLRVQAWLFFW